MKKLMSLTCFICALFCESAMAQTQMSDFLRNRDGTIKTRITQKEAGELCRALGKRLPTAREVAKVLAAEGRGTFFEYKNASASKTISGTRIYQVVGARNPDGHEDLFHFTPFNRMSGGNFGIWSSSVLPDNPDHAFNFNASNGSISFIPVDWATDEGSVRCISQE